MKISNVLIAGLEPSLRAMHYAKAVDVDSIEPSFELAQKLGNTPLASGHDCFLKGVVVQADIRAPQYWWLQWGRYHFADIVTSQSKMHRITKMNIKGQTNGFVHPMIIDIVQKLVDEYNALDDDTPKNEKEELFHKILSSCPMGLELTARVTTNYLQLKNMYVQRKNHRTYDWKLFCKWVENLPYFKEIAVAKYV
jgi:hypothetical protein